MVPVWTLWSAVDVLDMSTVNVAVLSWCPVCWRYWSVSKSQSSRICD